MVDTVTNSGDTPPQTTSILTTLTNQMIEALSKVQTPTQSTEGPTAPIGIRLDSSNYGLWSQVVKMYISGKDKLGFINGDYPPPPTTDPSFQKWRTDNAIVKGWLINSMDLTLIGNFIRFPTAKAVWDAIATTYFDGSDTSQVYELRRRVARLKQAGGSFEKFYTDLQGLWCEIDFRRPNPMECPTDIHHYNALLQEDRVYTFLNGIDDRLDNIRSDVLQMRPFPSIEQAYAHVRREALRQAVISAGDPDSTSGAVLATKGLKLNPSPSYAGAASSPHPRRPNVTPRSQNSKTTPDGLKCSHCGKQNHTSENCFKKNGYPDWWYELQAKKKNDGTGTDASTGKVAVASAKPHLSLIPQAKSQDVGPNSDIGNVGSGLATSSGKGDRDAWLLDSGALDHMTFDETDFITKSPPRRTSVANANGVVSSVTGAGTVSLSPSLQLSHTLLVPSLSHKLMSVSQVTEELKCVVLIYSTFCLLQDILTKEIIGCGTKRGGLYYVDDINMGHVLHVRSGGRERQIQLWHQLLGHPNFGYLKHVLPDLFF
jgi:hypothetical protein